jgi:uncharacterized C2H2 Zn-finger protein
MVKMTGIASKCTMCDRYFQSKKALREHINKEHRITNTKMRNVKNKADEMGEKFE